ncbi:hypothetical protein F9B85_09540 [Heliorestis acidaminivorans]|uniref:Beta propeller domain-containing protein n=1 Tax=Heliorestis acidaminivorans TaxID=553427 RepID=A0A6I0F586_9FIRM|nr:beta-propeller domain-containing protein [Heliorestis acidaminivorans]KAB2952387.1 hypothetical protein F9B85_09540 [Heliorestis acidaminivorans]
MKKLLRGWKKSTLVLYSLLTILLITACGAEEEGQKVYKPDLPALSLPQEEARQEHQLDISQRTLKVVEEGDLFQEEGPYLYMLKRGQLIIVQTYPLEEMKIVYCQEMEDNFYPLELYLKDRQLVLVGTVEKERAVYQADSYYGPATVKALIFDIAESGEIEVKREVMVDGRYISSRRIGDKIYLFANRSSSGYRASEGEKKATYSFVDSAMADNPGVIDDPEIHYFPYFVEPEYLTVASFSIVQHEQKAEIASYLGAGEYVYASEDSLYVAVTQYTPKAPLILAPEQEKVGSIEPANFEEYTSIFKFAIKDNKMVFKGQGNVPGTLLNRFAMVEKEGNLWIVTTKGNPWATGEKGAKQQFYILDETLSILGKVEELAPEEQLAAVAFSSHFAYLVTFQEQATFYVIDGLYPEQPTLSAKLPISSYSNYLHPYGDHILLGFGREKGIRFSALDLTDKAKPVEKFLEIIGQYGSDTTIFRDSRPLFFSKDNEIIAFPVTIRQIEGIEDEKFFQGVYLYRYDEEKGLKHWGKIPQSREKKDEAVFGIFEEGDNLYLLSESKLQVFGIDKLDYRSELTIP